jgi:hypothetical protein
MLDIAPRIYPDINQEVEAMGAQAQRARVFMSGRSKAVRIPADYRFHVDEVYP